MFLRNTITTTCIDNVSSALANVSTEQGLFVFVLVMLALLILKITKKIIHFAVIIVIAAIVLFLPAIVG